MWEIRIFSLQSGLKLMTTRMINEVFTNCTTEAGWVCFDAKRPNHTVQKALIEGK